MAEPGLVASPWQCAGAYCFVCAAMFGNKKHGYGPPPSLLAWFGPLRFFLVSENEIEASFAGCHWNSETIADCPTRDSKKSVPAVFPAVAETLDPLHNSEGEHFEGDSN
jgi:hypothetical protein